MKHLHRTLGALLVLVLTLSLFGTCAYAVDAFDQSMSGSVNQDFWCQVSNPSGEAINTSSYSVDSGALPPGLSLYHSATNVIVRGVPTAAGVYNACISFSTTYTNYVCDLTITISAPTYDCAITLTKGVTVENAYAGSVGAPISYAEVHNGSLPGGLSMAYSGASVFLNGTPKAAGSYTARIYCETTDGVQYLTLTVEVAGSTALTITKSPSHETVTAGESAYFIAAAENYSKLEWRVVSADGNNCWRGQNEIEGKFTGVKFSAFKSDDGREWLKLSDIPVSMDGYYIQAKFWSTDGSVTDFTETKSCKLTVHAPVLKLPVITVQPTDATAETGTPVTLSVTASDPNGGTLTYQWYSRVTGVASQGTPVSGATSATFTPPQTEGTLYYHVAITSTKDGFSSEVLNSAVVAVTYNAPAVTAAPAPEVTPAQQPTVTEAPAAATEAPAPSATPAPTTANRGGNTLFIILVVLFVLLLAALVVLLVLNARAKKAATWKCPFCGTVNTGTFCSECGTHKPGY